MSHARELRGVDSQDLLPQHAQLILQSAISPEVARARRYRSVTKKSELIELGFGRAQTRVPALLIPIWGVSGEIVLYQARPDTPRIEGGKPRKYETPRGSRMGIDVPPIVRQWLPDPSVPLFVTEGVRKADSAASLGLACVGLLGVWNWRGSNEFGGKVALADWESIALKDRTVHIVFDSDVVTKPEVRIALQRLKELLTSRGAQALVIYLPCGPHGEKVGLDDFLATGRTSDDLIALATPDLRRMEAAASEVRVGLAPYLIDAGRLCVERSTRDGMVTVPLCNFVARIADELTLDDGAETSRAFLLDGTLETGEHLPRVRVPSSRFGGMTWVTESWGLRAVVRAGLSTRDQLREAIQRLSRDAASHRVFTHTGWRSVDGRWIYLHAGGAVGAENVEVDLGSDLTRYRLPGPMDDSSSAMRASLDLLRVAPLRVTAPLWAATFRAPLASLQPADLSVWLEGQTGSLKSTLAALFLSHCGAFDRTSLPGAWSSTANQLERRAFILKDMLFVVDDYAPSPLDRNEMQAKAARLLRAQGNLAGRGRLNADLTERAGFPPRGLVLSTGEQHPLGHSILARLFLVDVDRVQIAMPLLDQCQKSASLLPFAMAGYISWLSPQIDSLRSTLKESFRGARARAYGSGSHLRIPEALAHLWLGLDCALAYAEEVGACGPNERADIGGSCWEALVESAESQSRAVEDERPSRRFLQILTAILTQRRGQLLPKDVTETGATSEPALLGWQDDTFLYLQPDAAFQAVSRFARDAGEPFPITQSRLRKELEVDHISEPDTGRTTASVWVGGSTRRVLRLRRTAVEKMVGQAGASASPDLTTLTGFQE